MNIKFLRIRRFKTPHHENFLPIKLGLILYNFFHNFFMELVKPC
jgi:hypothetical protein